MDRNKYFELLIDKYYGGTTTRQEEVELLNWKNKSSSNKQRFIDRESTYPFIENNLSFDYHNYLNFKDSINKPKKFKVINLLRYVAIFVATLSLSYGIYYFNYGNENTKHFIVSANRGEKCTIILPDGTKIRLNSESEISYSSAFKNGDRVVNLVGEAYFEVTKDKNNPFSVVIDDFKVNVLGTTFNVMAYRDFENSEVDLVEGEIEIEFKNKDKHILYSGKKLIYNKKTKSVKEIKLNKNLDAGWINNEFNFYNIKFKELAKRLERWYNVDIILTDKRIENLTFSGKFKNKETLWQVLDVIKQVSSIDYTGEDRTVVINYKQKNI